MTFYERLDAVCKEQGTTVTGMLKKLKLSTSKQGSWKKGSIPKSDVLALFCKELDVDADYLLCKSDVRKKYNPKDLTEEDQEFLQLFKSYTSEERENLINLMKMIKK